MNVYVLLWTDSAEMRCLHTLYSTFKNVMYIGCKLAQEIEIKCIWFHAYCLSQRGYFSHRSDWLQVDVRGSMPDRSTDFSLRHHVLTDSELRLILLASCKTDDMGPFCRIKGAGGTGPTGCCTGTLHFDVPALLRWRLAWILQISREKLILFVVFIPKILLQRTAISTNLFLSV